MTANFYPIYMFFFSKIPFLVFRLLTWGISHIIFILFSFESLSKRTLHEVPSSLSMKLHIEPGNMSTASLVSQLFTKLLSRCRSLSKKVFHNFKFALFVFSKVDFRLRTGCYAYIPKPRLYSTLIQRLYSEIFIPKITYGSFWLGVAFNLW